LSAVLLTVLLPIVIARNVGRGQAYRQHVARNVAEIPLGKLLVAHGLEINDYLYQRNLVDVHAQIGQCSGCDDAGDCDRALSQSVNFAPILAYCPNSTALNAKAA
jgi:hypothetical protein